ncbi:hypothetical protein FRX31_012251 [Thalictrum thalictroides]|uniref:Uncharacterized protein n=1 Tax=Thalictrum thalictroides TaxID=46969 RepID=A0A7J6WPV5_THATH|nr:hypothetical protein FRX31_012251 [Thalictrum thalictroides]
MTWLIKRHGLAFEKALDEDPVLRWEQNQVEVDYAEQLKMEKLKRNNGNVKRTKKKIWNGESTSEETSDGIWGGSKIETTNSSAYSVLSSVNSSATGFEEKGSRWLDLTSLSSSHLQIDDAYMELPRFGLTQSNSTSQKPHLGVES